MKTYEQKKKKMYWYMKTTFNDTDYKFRCANAKKVSINEAKEINGDD